MKSALAAGKVGKTLQQSPRMMRLCCMCVSPLALTVERFLGVAHHALVVNTKNERTPGAAPGNGKGRQQDTYK
jgi:hypothetical protein